MAKTKKGSTKGSKNATAANPKIQPLTDKNIYEQGILVTLKNGTWPATAVVDHELLGKNVPEDIVRASQSLLLPADKSMLKDVANIGKKAWIYISQNSMPCTIASCFFIRKSRIVDINERLLEFEAEQKKLVKIVIARYEDAKKDFKKAHPEYYKPEKYLSVEEIESSFYMKWSFRQFLPDAQLELISPELYKSEMQKFKEEVQEMKRLTVQAIAQTIIERVERLGKQCADDKINAKTVNNITKFVESFENEWDGFIAHKELKAIFVDVKKYVSENGSDILKDNEKIRDEVGKKMKKIVKQLENLPDVKVKRKLIF